jgi:hypothetical protein
VTSRVPNAQFLAYRGRKYYNSYNLLVDVDFDAYVLAGSEGFAHDATILGDNLYRVDGLHIPDGKF